MARYLLAIAFILFSVGCALALDFENGVEMRPGEKAAEELFEKGIGQPWVGGNPPCIHSSDFEPFNHQVKFKKLRFYPYQGKTYNPYCYYYTGSALYPFYCQST